MRLQYAKYDVIQAEKIRPVNELTDYRIEDKKRRYLYLLVADAYWHLQCLWCPTGAQKSTLILERMLETKRDSLTINYT